jgi:hypothetical protein
MKSAVIRADSAAPQMDSTGSLKKEPDPGRIP